jgi:hypothetical protein
MNLRPTLYMVGFVVSALFVGLLSRPGVDYLNLALIGQGIETTNTCSVDESVLTKLYQAIFYRPLDSDASSHLGQPLSVVLSDIINSQEHITYSGLINAVKSLEEARRSGTSLSTSDENRYKNLIDSALSVINVWSGTLPHKASSSFVIGPDQARSAIQRAYANMNPQAQQAAQFGLFNALSKIGDPASISLPPTPPPTPTPTPPPFTYSPTPIISFTPTPSNTATVSYSPTPSRTPTPSSSRTPTPVPSVPAQPTNLSSSTTSDAKVKLTWDDNSNNENGFAVLRSPDNFHTYKVDYVPVNATYYIDTIYGAIPGALYYYKVSAYNSVGYSYYSNTTVITYPSATTNNSGNSTSLTPAPTSISSFTPAPSQNQSMSACVGGDERVPGLPTCLMPENLSGTGWNEVSNATGVVLNTAVCSVAVCGRDGEWRNARNMNGTYYPNGYPPNSTYIQTPFDQAYGGQYFTNGVLQTRSGGIIQPGSYVITYPSTPTPTPTPSPTGSLSYDFSVRYATIRSNINFGIQELFSVIFGWFK